MDIDPTPRPGASSLGRTGLASGAGILAALLLASGCASPFQGKWKGACEVGVGSNRIEMPVQLDLVDSKGTTLRGAGTFDYNDFSFSGEARGRVADDEAMLLDVVGVYGGYTITLELEAELDTDEELEGLCSFTDQETLYEGDIELSIVGGE